MEQLIVDGKKAIVAYLKPLDSGGFTPVSKEEAVFVKVIYEDGTREFYDGEVWRQRGASQQE